MFESLSLRDHERIFRDEIIWCRKFQNNPFGGGTWLEAEIK